VLRERGIDTTGETEVDGSHKSRFVDGVMEVYMVEESKSGSDEFVVTSRSSPTPVNCVSLTTRASTKGDCPIDSSP